MKFVDTHTHLFSEEFDDDRAEVIKKAINSGVELMLLPNIESSTIGALKQCEAIAPGNCMPMMGLHPSSVGENYEIELHNIKEELFSGYRYIGVGEIGIDLYWDQTTLEIQKQAFITQCQWAVELDLAVSIHTRNAVNETIDCLRSLKKMPKGVFHCFTGTIEEANIISELGFKLGIGGVLTYKNSTLPEVLKSISPDCLVLETDSPYLPPIPYRGKRNDSSYIPIIAEKLASVYGMSIKDIADISTYNAENTFAL